MRVSSAWVLDNLAGRCDAAGPDGAAREGRFSGCAAGSEGNLAGIVLPHVRLL